MNACIRCGKVIPGKFEPNSVFLCRECADEYRLLSGRIAKNIQKRFGDNDDGAVRVRVLSEDEGHDDH